MKVLITLLTMASGVLPASGVWIVWRDINSRRQQLRAKLGRVKAIMDDPSLTEDERSQRIEEETPSESTVADVLFVRERIELQGLEQAPELTRPAVLAAAGLLCGVIAGLLSTWCN
ncbi:hypothetical protein AB0939_29520 [Streptomyces sp. NPDC006990]|uniref:hypothetical protein n=1 Tax=Streptomyces sp. NPDC006990 TaxID=3154481 RepID=UPI0034560B26